MKTRNELINEVKSLDLTQSITEFTESNDLDIMHFTGYGHTFDLTDDESVKYGIIDEVIRR